MIEKTSIIHDLIEKAKKKLIKHLRSQTMYQNLISGQCHPNGG